MYDVSQTVITKLFIIWRSLLCKCINFKTDRNDILSHVAFLQKLVHGSAETSVSETESADVG